MNKVLKTLPLLFIFSLVVSCSKSQEPENKKVNAHMPSYIVGHKGGYTLSLNYDDQYFLTDAKKINYDLALLSYGVSTSNDKRENIINIYKQMEFDNIETTSSYYAPSEDTISYLMGHRKIENYDLVSIAIRGFDYGQEWVNNFRIGKVGNHNGFEDSADFVYSNLLEYVSSHNYTNIKLWINGYSRGGGVSNVLAYKLLTKTDIAINQSDLYVYTFESPAGLLLENAMPYENVFNFINTADVIPLLAPIEYGFGRCGKDINIYNSDIDNIVTNFDSEISLGDFVSDEAYPTEVAFAKYLMTLLMEEREEVPLTNRIEFADNIEKEIGYLMAVLFSFTTEQQTAMFQEISSNLLIALATLLEEDGVYKLLEPFLERYHISFDEQRLKDAGNRVTELALALLPQMTEIVMGGGMGNISRMGLMHMPEVNWALLEKYATINR